ncbi:hypothetical protein T484DRAFT_2202607 [Baffinella frigidus]|nr:hypothetical protein T484DRAFT_2202607 [Cryptophyta sp. CCMP2293]
MIANTTAPRSNLHGASMALPRQHLVQERQDEQRDAGVPLHARRSRLVPQRKPRLVPRRGPACAERRGGAASKEQKAPPVALQRPPVFPHGNHLRQVRPGYPRRALPRNPQQQRVVLRC